MTGALYIPVILGTTRQGRMSAPVARFVVDELSRVEGVETGLIDLADIPLPVDDAGESIKDTTFASNMDRADGLAIVAPEYNHSFPGLLKHALDSCLKEYVHKAVGVVGVSAGPFGGTRVVQSLLPALREIGLVTIFWDVNVSHVRQAFGPAGELIDRSLARRTAKFLDELVWMAETLRYGRRHVTLRSRAGEPGRTG